MNKSNPIGTGSFSLNRAVNSVVGGYSFTEGYNTTASGNRSHAEGSDTIASGHASHAEGINTIASGYYSHAEGSDTIASGSTSHAEGINTIASGYHSHAEGRGTIASGGTSHAEGYFTIASGGYSHAEGENTIASGESSHAEGGGILKSIKLTGEANATLYKVNYIDNYGVNDYIKYDNKLIKIIDTNSIELTITVESTLSENELNGESCYVYSSSTASGKHSHAEGYRTTASGDYSHTEGYDTVASGRISHAEGYDTVASGESSHAEGYCTKAFGQYQHTHGKYNIEDSASTYVHIIGNGAIFARSNAHTLDWDGNAWYSGDVYVGSTSGVNKDEGSKKLATEEFVNNKVAKISNTDWNDLKNNLSQSIDNPWYYPIDAAKIEIYYQDSLFCTFVRTNLVSARGTSYWKYSGSCNNISIRNTLYGESFDFNDEENQAKVFFSTNFDRTYYDASGNEMMDVENNLIAKKNKSVTWLFGHLADMDENHVWNVINYFPITCNDCGKDNVALAMDMAHKYIAGLSNEPDNQSLKLTDTVTGIEYMITIANGKVTLTEVSE